MTSDSTPAVESSTNAPVFAPRPARRSRLRSARRAPERQLPSPGSVHSTDSAPGASQRRRRLIRRALLAADVAGLLTALAVTAATFPEVTAAVLASAALLSLGSLAICGLYGRDEVQVDHSTADDLGGIFLAVTLGTWLGCAVEETLLPGGPTVGALVAFWVVATIATCAWRIVARTCCRRQEWYQQNVLVVGSGDVGRLVVGKYRKHPEYGARVVGYVDSDPPRPTAPGAKIVGGLESLGSLIRERDVERVVVAFTKDSHGQVLRHLAEARASNVQVDVVPRLFEAMGPRATIHAVEGLPMVALPPLTRSPVALAVKRSIDIAVSVAGLMALAPLLALVAVSIRLDSKGPVLYRGRRIGRGGREFRILKFRTMRPGSDSAPDPLSNGNGAGRTDSVIPIKTADDPRITRAGRVLRRTSLDELPQLINVLRGDLSLVGPRPLTSQEWKRLFVFPSELPADTPGYWLIDDLRPGVTGYWQINGRSSIGYEERMRLDMAYVASWSLALDFEILARTVRAVTSAHGAY